MFRVPTKKHIRKARAVSGLDVFQSSDARPPVPVIPSARGGTRPDVGGWRKACKAAWDALSSEQQREFNLLAAERNELAHAANSADAASGGGGGEEQSSEDEEDEEDHEGDSWW